MAALCVFLTAACGFDYRDKRIPNKLILCMAAWGAVWRCLGECPRGALSYLGQALFVVVILYPFFKIGGLGAGDVKLLGVTAGYFSKGKILVFLLSSLLIAVIISMAKMWKRGCFVERFARLADNLAKIRKSGSCVPYPERDGEHRVDKVCLSGPVFVSVLLYLGGVY